MSKISQSFFKFYAQTSPGLENILLQELRSLGIKGRMRGDISHIQFQASYEQIFKVLHEVRTIESLKIQVGKEIQSRSEEELEKNMQKLPWSAFLPIDNLYQYNQPLIHSKSYRSNIYHEKLLNTIIEKQLNLLMVRKEYKQLNSLTGGRGDMTNSKSMNKEVRERKKEIENHKQLIISNRELRKEEESNNKLTTLPSLPDVYIYLVKDKATLLLKLHLDSLHKHSLKPKVGWAPIKEGIVAGSLISMDFKSRFQSELKVWDPFCGSGSIVLELLSMMFQRRIRDKFDFFYLKNFPQQEYQKYLESDNFSEDNSSPIEEQEQENQDKKENEDKEAEEENQDALKKQEFIKQQQIPFGRDLKQIQIIASDISGSAISNSIGNFHHSGLEDSINKFLEKKKSAGNDHLQNIENISMKQNTVELPVENTENQENLKRNSSQDNIQKQKSDQQIENSQDRLNQLAPFYIQESFCEQKVRFIRSDFEALSKFVDLNGFTIITNLPFGIRSKEHIDDKELMGSFKRFSKVIRKNLNSLKDVFVYTTVHEKYHSSHFIHISKMAWTIKQKYTLGGLQIGLFQLNKEVSATTRQYQVFDEQDSNEREKRLQIMEKKLNNSKLEDDELGKQLRQIIGDRSDKALKQTQENESNSNQSSPALVPRGLDLNEVATMSQKEKNEYNRQLEMKSNLRNLKEAAKIEDGIKKELDRRSQTPRQIKSIAIRRKIEYAKALRLRALMQRDSYIQSLNNDEIQRRIESKRNRLNAEFIKSVMDSVGVEDKEDALDEIQDKLNKKAEQKVEKKKVIEKKKENKRKVPRWY